MERERAGPERVRGPESNYVRNVQEKHFYPEQRLQEALQREVEEVEEVEEAAAPRIASPHYKSTGRFCRARKKIKVSCDPETKPEEEIQPLDGA
uniref:Uncharacterized protein n=1 Tax=Knipowitschia caucasica TaxID=637954 RepID=A0AAV2JMI8_KNICA